MFDACSTIAIARSSLTSTAGRFSGSRITQPDQLAALEHEAGELLGANADKLDDERRGAICAVVRTHCIAMPPRQPQHGNFNRGENRIDGRRSASAGLPVSALDAQRSLWRVVGGVPSSPAKQQAVDLLMPWRDHVDGNRALATP